MLCVGCPEIWPKLPPKDVKDPDKWDRGHYLSHLEDSNSGADHVKRLSAVIRKNQRVINPDAWGGIEGELGDPELGIWEAMESVVCQGKSAFADEQQCLMAQLHIDKTFYAESEPVEKGEKEEKEEMLLSEESES